MELAVLRDKMLTLLGVDSVDDMPEALMRVVMSSDERVLNDAKSTFPDLSRDWIQPIFQYYQVMFLNNEENRLLAELRDALLPKLMSGEIEV